MASIHLVWLLLGGLVSAHPFYISLTDIMYRPDAGRIEIAQKVFWDDLEVALGAAQREKINFLNPADQTRLETLVESYLMEHNEIVINGELIEIRYLGYEIEDDAAWFYMEAEYLPVPETVLIKNTLLFEHFPSQQNIVNFYRDKKPKSLITTLNRPKGTLNFSTK